MASKFRTKFERVICALFGHSKIQDHWFWRYHCGRCGVVVGDSLLGCYNANNIVVIGHNCEKCRENYKHLKWHDKWLVKNPFTEE